MNLYSPLATTAPHRPSVPTFKTRWCLSVLRNRLCGISMMGEDLPVPDPCATSTLWVRDFRGLPVARITDSPGGLTNRPALLHPPHRQIMETAGAGYVTAVSNAN